MISPKVENLIKRTLDVMDAKVAYRRVWDKQKQNIEFTGEIHLFALGKAAVDDARAFKSLVTDQEFAQVVVYSKEGHGVCDFATTFLEGDHPHMSERNLKNTSQFMDCLEGIGPNDTLVFLLSGGGSALLELPKITLSFEELQKKNRELLSSGLSIEEMNIQRKSLSQVKNGGLLASIATTNIYQFLVCDIPSLRLQDVSSGPLMSGDDESKWPQTFVVNSAQTLLTAFDSFYVGKIYNCELDEMLSDLEIEIKQLDKNQTHVSAGEATVKVPEVVGRGGRNTHFVLALANKLYQDEQFHDIHILSIGTDGNDGDTDAAGAYMNYNIFKDNNISDHLANFSSYDYFEKASTLIKTGPTGSNLMDLRFIWRE